MGDSMQELQAFVDEWSDSDGSGKAAFVRLKAYLSAKGDAILEFIPRSGVTYSLRAAHPNQKKRDLFVMVDVIEDSPRWLSVCFYGDMVTDPEERGDFVPEGLLGEDAACFDIDDDADALLQYVESRIDEAFQNASGQQN